MLIQEGGIVDASLTHLEVISLGDSLSDIPIADGDLLVCLSEGQDSVLNEFISFNQLASASVVFVWESIGALAWPKSVIHPILDHVHRTNSVDHVLTQIDVFDQIVLVHKLILRDQIIVLRRNLPVVEQLVLALSLLSDCFHFLDFYISFIKLFI